MDKKTLSRTKKDKLVLLARRNNIRGAHLMTKERLVDALMRLSARKTKTKKGIKARSKVQKVIGRIRVLPQHKLKKAAFAQTQPNAGAASILAEAGQQRVEEAKYYSGLAPAARKTGEFQFPAGYGDNKIVIMVRDPWWMYAYWEISQEKENKVRDKIIQRRLAPVKSILRVYDVTGIEFNGSNAHSSFDIELRDFAANWYINVGTPNRAWLVDIGILASNNEFFLLARSNCVRTPRFGMSEVVDEEWMSQEDDYWRMFGLSGGFGAGKGSLALKKMFKKRLLEQLSSQKLSRL